MITAMATVWYKECIVAPDLGILTSSLQLFNRYVTYMTRFIVSNFDYCLHFLRVKVVLSLLCVGVGKIFCVSINSQS